MKTFRHLCTALLLLCGIAANAHDFEVDGIYYNITDEENRTVEVTNAIINEGDVVIPSTTTYEGATYTVTSIGEDAFFRCSSLTAINIPEGVTSIGNYAFYNCSSLTAINIPEGVTSIGDYAFYECSRLTSITLPESVTSIGDYAFCNCSSLTAINIPEGVTSIGETAFYNCI